MKMSIIELLLTELKIIEPTITRSDILTFTRNAPNRYKVYSIPKRTSGLRTIAHPSKTLKLYQRVLSTHFENILPIHDSAFAYRKGLSIKQNAQQHKNNKYLLKMDFENFFNSITPVLFHDALKKSAIKLTKEDLMIITKLCFWCPSKTDGGKLILSVGAPISPVISNFIMNEFDESISGWCENRKITYTRYADDISFSNNVKGVLFLVPEYIESTLKNIFSNQILIKASKTVFSSKAHNRHITGITITNEGTLSIGRNRKRYISSLIHKFKLNKLTQEETEHMKGLLAFAFDIEPIFKERMILKYSNETMDKINQFMRGNKDGC